MSKERRANADDDDDDWGCHALCTVKIFRQVSVRRRANACDNN